MPMVGWSLKLINATTKFLLKNILRFFSSVGRFEVEGTKAYFEACWSLEEKKDNFKFCILRIHLNKTTNQKENQQ